jgi:hypothetical protein
MMGLEYPKSPRTLGKGTRLERSKTRKEMDLRFPRTCATLLNERLYVRIAPAHRAKCRLNRRDVVKKWSLKLNAGVICWDGEGDTFSFPVGFCAHYDLKNNVSPGASLVERRERVHNPICVLEAWALTGW